MDLGKNGLSSAGDPKGSVGLSTLRRDGFGYLSVRRGGEALLTTIPPGSTPRRYSRRSRAVSEEKSFYPHPDWA